MKNSSFNRAILYFEAWILPLFFFLGIWWFLSPENEANWIAILAAVLLLGTLFLSYRSRLIWPSKENRYFFSRSDAWKDGLLLLSPLLIGFWLAGGVQSQFPLRDVLFSLATYPVYALLQLSIFLAIPSSRMRHLGHGTLLTCMACAAVFFMAHFPNTLLMVFTGLAMLLLCQQFLKGRSLLALALVMGLAATGFKMAVPTEYSWEMRIGPDYLEKRLATESSQVK